MPVVANLKSNKLWEEQNQCHQKQVSLKRRGDMAVEEKLKSKLLYKLQLLVLKAMPMCMAFFAWLNTVLSYFDIDCEVLSHIGGCSVITLIFIYLSSYVFRFCEYHKMFLHYITVLWAIQIYDLYVGIPVSDLGIMIVYQIITGIVLFVILYLYVKGHKRTAVESSREYRFR